MLKDPGSVELEQCSKALERERDLAAAGFERIEAPQTLPLRTELTFTDQPIAIPDTRVAAAIADLKRELTERFDGRIRDYRSRTDEVVAFTLEANSEKAGLMTPTVPTGLILSRD